MDEAALINTFYPSMDSAQSRQHAASATPQTDPVTTRLFPDAAKAPAPKLVTAALDEDHQQSRAMYGKTDPTLTHGDATRAITSAAMEDNLSTPYEAAKIAAQWAGTFAQHELTSTDSAQIVDIAAAAAKNPPSPEIVATWTEQAIQHLQTTYGVQGAGQALRDARAYVQHTGVADLLDAWGLGAHPKLVALAAAKGRALRLAGKLK